MDNSNLEQFLQNCDFYDTRDLLIEAIHFSAKEAEKQGEELYVNEDVLEALQKYIDNPCLETAKNLIQINSGFYDIFNIAKS
ncbi:MAG: hypothetical protein Q8936_11760 [Bacillota bacterium]|nr:hypothetical protein [Bacillota bacterium]